MLSVSFSLFRFYLSFQFWCQLIFFSDVHFRKLIDDDEWNKTVMTITTVTNWTRNQIIKSTFFNIFFFSLSQSRVRTPLHSLVDDKLVVVTFECISKWSDKLTRFLNSMNQWWWDDAVKRNDKINDNFERHILLRRRHFFIYFSFFSLFLFVTACCFWLWFQWTIEFRCDWKSCASWFVSHKSSHTLMHAMVQISF